MAELKGKGKKVFADLKLFDIPATVAAAVRQLARHEVNFCTVHGNDGMLKAAADAKGNMQILAVTALTSLDQGDLDDLGFQCGARTLRFYPGQNGRWRWAVTAWCHPAWRYRPCASMPTRG